MKTLHNLSPSLIERSGDHAVPNGGGLMLAVAISLAFWGTLVWWVL